MECMDVGKLKPLFSITVELKLKPNFSITVELKLKPHFSNTLELKLKHHCSITVERTLKPYFSIIFLSLSKRSDPKVIKITFLSLPLTLCC